MGKTDRSDISDDRYNAKNLKLNTQTEHIQTSFRSDRSVRQKEVSNHFSVNVRKSKQGTKQNTHSTSSPSSQVQKERTSLLGDSSPNNTSKGVTDNRRYNVNKIEINARASGIQTNAVYKDPTVVKVNGSDQISENTRRSLERYENKTVRTGELISAKEDRSSNVTSPNGQNSTKKDVDPGKTNITSRDASKNAPKVDVIKTEPFAQNMSSIPVKVNYNKIKIQNGKNEYKTKERFENFVKNLFNNSKREEFFKNFLPKIKTEFKEHIIQGSKVKTQTIGTKIKGKFKVIQGSTKKLAALPKRERVRNTKKIKKQINSVAAYPGGLVSATKGRSIETSRIATSTGKSSLSFAKGAALSTARTISSKSDDYTLKGFNQTLKSADSTVRAGEKVIHTAKDVKKVSTMLDKTVKSSKMANNARKAKQTSSLFARIARQKAINKAMKEAAKKTGKTVAKTTVRVTVKTTIETIKLSLGPLRAILAVIGLILLAIAAIVVVILAVGILIYVLIQGIFSIFGRSGEVKVDEYLADPTYGVVAYSKETKDQLYQDSFNALKANGGTYDIVRIKTGTEEGTVFVEVTPESIASAFYTDVELIDLIAPMYSATIYMKYGGQPTEEEATAEVKELYEKLFTITSTETTEYCGQSVTDGSGVAFVACPNCGWIHALDDCPNYTSGIHDTYQCPTGGSYIDYVCLGHDDGTGKITYCSTVSGLPEPCSNCEARVHNIGCDHTTYTCDGYLDGEPICGKEVHIHSCSECCKYYGRYHRTHDFSLCGKDYHEHNDDINSEDCCYQIYYCNDGNEMDTRCIHSCTEHMHCDGYKYCNGHNALTYDISLDGMYALIDEIFLTPMETLRSKTELTEEEKKELSNLEGWYDIFNTIMAENPRGHIGTGLSLNDLKEVQWVPSTRPGCDAIVNLALSHNGYVGGALFWKEAGYESRVPWCAIFVNWCFKHTPSVTDRYAKTENNDSCQKLVAYHKVSGQFHSRDDWRSITKGDCIFFDWECDGVTDHVGFVIGRDEDFVYTIEGNSSDSVRIKKYNLNSNVIYGYVFINY